MNKSVTDINVHELLPQKAPFVMIDKLTFCDYKTTTTTLAIKDDNIFCDNGYFSSFGIIENIAQTCAARIGYFNMISGEPVKLGFIGSVRNLQIERTPVIGESLETTIHVREEIFGLTLVDAEVKVENETIASTEMKIAISNIDAEDKAAH